MNRELKFRIVNHNIICAIEYLSELGWKHKLLNTLVEHDGCFDDKFWQHKKSLIRNQFTGMKDGEGVDIYEGDILEFKGIPLSKGSIVRLEGDSYKPLNLITVGGMYARVIGNIYENKNILNDTDTD